MILFDFEYERPETLEGAVASLVAAEGLARPVAGGTDLLPNMRVENVKPTCLVSLSGIAHRPPELLADGSLTIDALMPLAAIAMDPLVGLNAPLVSSAAHTVGGNQIRQRGTLGGNLCQETRCLQFNQKHDYQFVEPCYKRGGGCCYPFPTNEADLCWSVYMSDVAPGIVALDAAVDVLGPKGLRRMPIEDLFSGDGMRPIALEADELLVSLVIPPSSAGTGWGYQKSAVRGGLEFGMAVTAAVVGLEDDGETCRDVRVVVGAVERRPVRPLESELFLVGRKLDSSTLSEAASLAADELRPLPHHGFTKKHLTDTIRVSVEAVLGEAVERGRANRSDS